MHPILSVSISKVAWQGRLVRHVTDNLLVEQVVKADKRQWLCLVEPRVVPGERLGLSLVELVFQPHGADPAEMEHLDRVEAVVEVRLMQTVQVALEVRADPVEMAETALSMCFGSTRLRTIKLSAKPSPKLRMSALGRLVHKEIQDQSDHRVRMVLLVLLDHKVLRVKWVQPDHKVQQEQWVPLALPVQPVQHSIVRS